MNLSMLIKALNAAQEQYGDVPVMLMDEESGNWHPLAEVLRLHPYTAPHGCLNRAEPVSAIALSRNGGNTPDLVLANAKDQEHRMTDDTLPQDDAAMSPASTGYGRAGRFAHRGGLVAAMIQTDSFGKVAGIRHQERDVFPPDELIPLYLCPQLTVSENEKQAIKVAIGWLTTLSSRRREIHSADLLLQDARTLAGLLERIR